MPKEGPDEVPHWDCRHCYFQRESRQTQISFSCDSSICSFRLSVSCFLLPVWEVFDLVVVVVAVVVDFVVCQLYSLEKNSQSPWGLSLIERMQRMTLWLFYLN